jgi:hypothetical protein
MIGMILMRVNQDIFMIAKKNKEIVNVLMMVKIDASLMLDI